MKVTVAICTLARYDGVLRAVKSLLAQSEYQRIERILVVVNGPTPASFAATPLGEIRALPGLKIIREPCLGVSNARNRALSACNSDLLAFLDDDCIAEPDWLECLLSTFTSAGSHLGAVGGRSLGIWSTPPPPWLNRSLMGYLSLVDFGEMRTEIVPPLYIVGGNVLYTANALRIIGGFKAHLGRIGELLLSNEEVDVCNSLRANGRRIIYEPSARIGHVVDPTRLNQAWFRRRIFWQAVSDLLMKAGDLSVGANQNDIFAWAHESTSVPVEDPVKNAAETLPAHEFLKQLRNVYRSTVSLSEGTRPSTLPF